MEKEEKQECRKCILLFFNCPTLDEKEREELCYNPTSKERKRRLPAMREPYSGIHPCEEIPLAKEIYERY